MTTNTRIAVQADWPQLNAYDDRGHTYGFPTVIAERDGHLVGYMASRAGREDAIECNAIKAESSFIALRLMEAYESILQAFDVKGYIFTMRKDAPDFLQAVLRLPDTVRYEETAEHVFGMRMLHHGRRQRSTPSDTH